MVGTGVMGPPGSIRAGFLVNQTMKTRNAFRCSITMIIDGMIVTANGFFHSFVKSVIIFLLLEIYASGILDNLTVFSFYSNFFRFKLS